MLFRDRYSGLVRLSDTIKVQLETCGALTEAALGYYDKHRDTIARAQAVAPDLLREATMPADTDERARAAVQSIPPDDALAASSIQASLHSFALTTILACCFCLESYVNALAFYLFRDEDYLAGVRRGRDITAEILLEALERMSTRQKWKQLARFGGGSGFDAGRPPYQDFAYLFNFRDDLVHDKPIGYDSDRSKRRYNRKLPDPVLGQLDLRHGMFAATTYWTMIESITTQLELDPVDFHGHYVLTPWRSAGMRQRLEDLARRYASVVPDET